MVRRSDDDPGFWRRPLSRRAQAILFIAMGAIILGGIVYALASGMRLF